MSRRPARVPRDGAAGASGRGRLARLASGVAVLGAVAAVAAVGSGLPAPAAPAAPDAAVAVPPAATDLVCPGPVVLPEQTTAGDAAFDPTPVRTRTTLRVASTEVADGGAGPVTVLPVEGGEPLLDLDAARGALVGEVTAPAGPTVLHAEPTGGRAPLVGGTVASVTTRGDLRGLAAATCRTPSAEGWLVGGSTELGSSATLVVSNPGRTPAEVGIAVWGAGGPVEDLGGSGFLVAPGAERAVLLEGVAAEQRRLVVHVTAAGGLVSAYLQDSRLEGFTPAGTDLVTPGAAPATRQVVGGLLVQRSRTGDEDAAVLRLLAPDDAATARLTLLGADGPVTLPGAERVALVPGEVTDVSLAGLPAGGYTAVVDADAPVVAGAMLSRPGPPVELGDVPTLERAWVASRAAGATGIVALPAGLRHNLFVGAVPDPAGDAGEPGSAAPATGVLRALGADGRVLATRELAVPAGRTERVVVRELADDVAALELVATGDAAGAATLAPWVVATTGRSDATLLSVLAPVSPPDPTPLVEVREGARIGLP